jgi:hypothetical protein
LTLSVLSEEGVDPVVWSCCCEVAAGVDGWEATFAFLLSFLVAVAVGSPCLLFVGLFLVEAIVDAAVGEGLL